MSKKPKLDQRIDLAKDEAENIEVPNPFNAFILEGTVLDNSWVIGKQTRSTEHANIYSVTQKRHGDNEDDAGITYEARSYNFESISPQVKSQRARAIRRISGRTVSSTNCNGLRVIVYRTGAVIQEKKENMKALPRDMLVAESACKPPKQKTTRQKESDRLRQKSRRRRVKQEKRNVMSEDDDQQLQNQDHQGPELDPARAVCE